MVDNLTKSERSKRMSLIKSKDTKPEMIIRKALHATGFRCRLNNKNQPGNPDLVLKKYNAVIFVHGCFWHYHQNCSIGHIPKSRKEYWTEKLGKNIDRDAKVLYLLKQEGWRTAVVWECSLSNKKNIEDTVRQLKSWLISDSEYREIG